ncbi:2-dehydro-3-deoxy-6-phosphogalactonate aldolase [Uliginosibacterium sp. sgz301328]|uniref:2-dehydro-3-deoxy-6-phosphogalactonate aldolase n=1 Tax=Uliginosibacterium sp. sgz301328 TaxID=3243764 RepID=UPI00359D96FB
MTDATSIAQAFEAAMRQLPLVAILRGLAPQQALPVSRALYDAGFRLIEVPLNSPQPFDSIALIRKQLPADALVGAGTVLRVDDIARLRDVGGQLVVMPHSNGDIIRATKAAGLVSLPGVVSPAEAFAALEAGADALKFFPAELVTPAVLRAMRAVLPRHVPLLPVGGITPQGMAPFVAAGAHGFGLGSALYAPHMSADDVARNAAAFVEAWRGLDGRPGAHMP